MTDKHAQDVQRVSAENTFTDLTRTGEHLSQGGLFTRMVNGVVIMIAEANPHKGQVWEKTDFDQQNLTLNQMLDLVEGTDPEDLETSGKALWDARDAITEAADELDGRIDKLPWTGGSGDAFRKWGKSLVTSTRALSTFAGSAGDQITAAGMGLASVRGSMPSRDTRPDQRKPEHFTEAEKVANKDEYNAAVRVEKDRQEAINQMNRLASYYVVSEGQLKDATPPTFKAMPDVGVPKPHVYQVVGPSENSGPASVGSHHSTVEQATRVGSHDTSDTRVPSKDVTGRVAHPDIPVGTNIDSVGTLPPSTTPPVTGHTPPALGTPGPGSGQPNLFEGGLGTPLTNRTQSRNLGGSGGLRTPSSTQGRTGTSGLNNPSPGRSGGQGSTNQMGRATSTGQSAAKGLASGAKSSPMGGRGISGGTPRSGSTATPRTASGPATGAGRSNGVVGGRPAAGDASAKGGSRIPRGTVVGGEGAANSRSVSGRPGQRGIFGTPEPTTRPGAGANNSRAGAGASEAVTGRPTTRNSPAGAERNGMTRGGAGLVRGPGQNGKPGDDSNAQGSSRPDYLVEAEETHLPNKPRRDVPPVVN
ncbi:hypothetical protein OG604_32900 [Streptomyces sp. NBC_01231]|nr:hypothetical protein OG604_32900 [Streptomyces sp. NBC_01231]